jgi:hypothetical protein
MYLYVLKYILYVYLIALRFFFFFFFNVYGVLKLKVSDVTHFFPYDPLYIVANNNNTFQFNTLSVSMQKK